MARSITCESLNRLLSWACRRSSTGFKTKRTTVASMAMMAMTIRSSIRVKDRRLFFDLPGVLSDDGSLLLI